MDYELIRSKRRSLALEISNDGSLLVRAPKKMDIKEIEAFIKEKENWINKHRDRFAVKRDREQSSPLITENDLNILKKNARLYFPDKVKYYAQIIGVTYGKITIRCQHSLWGSCSSKGNLNFNCLLMMMDEDIRDYIIVHELCHRRHMNHSKTFWKTVESILPDYRQRQLRLKKEGQPLLNSVRKNEENSGTYYTYILRCSDNSLYTGYTNNLEKRVSVHNSGKGAKYTRLRRPVVLVYSETFPTKKEAMRREALIKQMTKREKERLIKG